MPLRYLFIDMNAYFASVEQHDNPRLRGRPIAVIPMEANTTCCLAASYTAKAYGIRTGTPVWQARQMCPELITVVARHERYVEIHKQIVRAVNRCIPVSKVMSIDEMACKLIGDECQPEKATAIARSIKYELRHSVGEVLTCSIGAGPNVMLAKVAGDMQKPDGLTILRPEEFPQSLYPLKITDFPGIGPRMEKRFHRYGITTTEQLLTLSANSLGTVWGSKIHGYRWYHLLRGEDVADIPTRRRTVGHSHMLPPWSRTREGSRAVMIRLIHKACARLRSLEHWAGQMDLGVKFVYGGRWSARVQLPPCQDTFNWLQAFSTAWEQCPPEEDTGPVLQVWMTLSHLTPAVAITPSLFDEDRRATQLSHTMDKINRVFGKQSIRYGGLCGAEESAPLRIAFSHIPRLNPATV